MLERIEKDSQADEDQKFQFIDESSLKLGPNGQPLRPQPSSDPADPLVSASPSLMLPVPRILGYSLPP